MVSKICTIRVTQETRDRVAALKYRRGFSTMNDTIRHLLEAHEEKGLTQ